MSTLTTEPINAVKTALYGALDAALSATVVEDGKQANKPLPVVTYQRQGGSGIYTLGGVTHWRYIFAVKAIAGGASSKAAGEIAADISEALLADDPLTFQPTDGVELVEGGVIWLSPIDLTETSDGGPFSHVGAAWEINVRSAA